tara:strand:+ start:369 stop:863 length:495 start_codon:yes stop_codon:yes gene_type:complete
MKTGKVDNGIVDAAKRMVVKILRLGANDVQTSKQISPFGVDSNPIKDMVAIQGETSIKGETVIIGYIGKEHITEAGETRLYSTDADGVLKATIHLKADDTLEMMGDSNFAVKFNELETAFNELKTKFNSHTHTGVTAGAGVTGTTPTPSTANISAAKNIKIKTN